MNIDIQTLLIANGAVVGISGVSFILSTALRRNETYGRTWAIAFVAGMLSTISYIIWGATTGTWWAAAIGNGAIVLALALMWAGCRQFNDRRPLLPVALGAAAIVVTACLIEGPDGGDWAGAWALFLGVSLFAAFAGIESLRGRLRHTFDARVLTVVFWTVALYYFLRMLVFLTLGENNVLFTGYFGTVTTSFIGMVLVIVAAISMTAIQPTTATRATTTGTRTESLVIPGVSDRIHFEQQAGDWLVRAKRDKEQLVLLTLAVDGLGHINSAFGKEFGDDTIYTVGRITCRYAPGAALIAHTGGGRFLMLTTSPTIGSPKTIAERIQTALVETPVDRIKGIRAIATFGVASTEEAGYELSELATLATGALNEAKTIQPGTIVLSSTLQ